MKISKKRNIPKSVFSFSISEKSSLIDVGNGGGAVGDGETAGGVGLQSPAHAARKPHLQPLPSQTHETKSSAFITTLSDMPTTSS